MSSKFTFSRRSCGVLLHPTSLPGHHGSGDLGPAAYRFVDFLASAGQTWWQMLPVNPPGDPPGNSPYSSTSAFAGSPWLISLDLLVEEGLLSKSDVAPEGSLNGHVVAQLRKGLEFRSHRLRKAFTAFERRRGGADRDAFAAYCRQHRQWLDDWALYAALRDKNDGTPSYTWPQELRLRKPAALREARQTLAGEVRYQQFLQFVFDRQWSALRAYAHGRGVGLIGDIPIFVSHDSADVWAHRSLFLLDEQGMPKAISGYPPDSFNALGQTWGHSQYAWAAHKREKFAWWIRRFKETLALFDGVRIDHFLGFHRTWHIPYGAANAKRGKWVPSPGFELFRALKRALPDAQIIAEDLGKLTPQAAKLRDTFNFPGMRVMQFGFGPGGDYHLPHRYPKRSVIYPGTHDNNTIVGWLEELRTSDSVPLHKSRASEYSKVLRYLNSDGRAGHMDLIRAAMSSVADTVIFQAQDILGLDTRSRMNVPGTAEGNWRWRLREGQLAPSHAAKLREMCELYDRMSPLAPLAPSPSTLGEGGGEGRTRRRGRAKSLKLVSA